jgi:hypothetical protein
LTWIFDWAFYDRLLNKIEVRLDENIASEKKKKKKREGPRKGRSGHSVDSEQEALGPDPAHWLTIAVFLFSSLPASTIPEDECPGE